ncbi:hypothetical protein BH23ACT4_BH23ACT4_02570 [soil metagenome]
MRSRWPSDRVSLPVVQLLANLQSDLTLALKARDSVKVSVIRSFLSSIANAGAVPLSPPTDAVGVYAGDSVRRTVETEEVRRLLEAEMVERIEASSAYTDRAALERMQREAHLIEEYLSSL